MVKRVLFFTLCSLLLWSYPLAARGAREANTRYVLSEKATEAFQKNDFETAIIIYEDLLKENPRDEEIFTNLTIAYINLFNCFKNYNVHSAQDIQRLRNWLRKAIASYYSFYASSLKWFYLIVTFIIIVLVGLDSYMGKRKKEVGMTSAFKENKVWEQIIIITLLVTLFICYRSFLWRAAANNSEFLFRGCLGKDLIDGLKTNFFAYRTAAHDSSMSLVGVLCAPFFLLLGDSFFSLHMVALLLPLSSMLALYYFTSQYFNRDVAIIASYMYVTLPFGYLFYYTYVLGFHSDSTLFILIAFSILYKIFFTTPMAGVYYGVLERRDVKQKLLFLFALLGLLCGCATYLCYSFLACLAVVLLFWFIMDIRIFLRKYWYIFCFSFLLILTPWILFNIVEKYHGFYIPYEGAAEPIFLFNSFFSKGVHCITTLHCLRWTIYEYFKIYPFITLWGMQIPPFIPKYLLCHVLFLALCVSFYASMNLLFKYFTQKSRAANNNHVSGNSCLKEVIIFTYIFVMIVLYCFYFPIWPTLNYLHPIFPFVFILVGLMVTRLQKVTFGFIKLRSVAAMIVIVILFSGFYFQKDTIYHLKEFNNASFKNMYTMKGYSLAHLPDDFLKNWKANDFLISDLRIAGFGGNKMQEAFNAVMDSWLTSNNKRNWHTVEKNYKYVKNVNPQYRPFLYVRLGITVGDGLHEDSFSSLANQIDTYVDKKYHHYLYEGIAISYGNRTYKEVLHGFQLLHIEKFIPPEYRHYFYIELGRRIGEKYKHNLAGGLALLTEFSEAYEKFLVLGYTSSLSQRNLRELLYSNKHSPSSLLKRYGYFYYGKNYYNSRVKNVHASLNDSVKQIPLEFVQDYIWGVVDGIGEYIYYYHFRIFESEKYVPPPAWNIIKDYRLLNAFENSFYPSFFQGLGLSIGLRSFGRLSDIDHNNMNTVIPPEYLERFYLGYGFGLALRYGNDEVTVTELIEMYIPPPFKDEALEGWHYWIRNFNNSEETAS